MFGFHLLQQLRDVNLECQIIRDQEATHFTKEMETIQQYYKETRKVFSQPGMEEFVTESEKDIEENLKKTMAALEAERAERMQQLQAECDFRTSSLLASKKTEALSYARYLLQHNLAEFMRLCMDVGEYANQLEYGVQYCQELVGVIPESARGDAYERCYGAEAVLLVTFIRQFVSEAIAYTENFGDDEDYTYYYSGMGSAEVSSPSPSPATRPIYNYRNPTDDRERTPSVSRPTEATTVTAQVYYHWQSQQHSSQELSHSQAVPLS